MPTKTAPTFTEWTIWDMVWGIIRLRVHDVDQRLVDVWNGMVKSVIDNAIDDWCIRLRSCVWAKWVHFEHNVCHLTDRLRSHALQEELYDCMLFV